MAILKRALRRINDTYLSADRFLMNQSDISIADLSAAQEILQLDLFGIDFRSEYPKLTQWLERVQKRMEPHWAVSNAALNKVVAKRRSGSSKLSAAAAASVGSGEKKQASANPTAGGEWSPAANALQTGALMSELRSQLSSPEGAAAIQRLQATFKFVVTSSSDVNQPATCWIMDLKTPGGAVKEVPVSETASTKADATFTLSDEAFVGLATGKLNPQIAFLNSKLKVCKHHCALQSATRFRLLLCDPLAHSLALFSLPPLQLAGNFAKAMQFNTVVFQNATIKKKIQEGAKAIIPSKL